MAACYLQHVETKLRFQVRDRIVAEGHFVAKLPAQLGIKNGYRPIDRESVTVYIRPIMRNCAQSKSVFVQVKGLIEQRLEKIRASDIMNQIAEEPAAERIVSEVLNDAATVSVTVGNFEFFLCSIRKTLY